MVKSLRGFAKPLPVRGLTDMPFRLRRIPTRQALGAAAVMSLTFLLIIIGVYAATPDEQTRNQAKDTFALLSDDELTRFLKIGLTADDNLRAAIRAAATRDTDQATVALAHLTEHPNFLVRVEVARALGHTSHLLRDAGISAAKTLLRDQEYLVRSFTARSLAANDSAKIRNLLKHALIEEKHDIVRFALTRALVTAAPTDQAR